MILISQHAIISSGFISQYENFYFNMYINLAPFHVNDTMLIDYRIRKMIRM